jgi:hypothetical protein
LLLIRPPAHKKPPAGFVPKPDLGGNLQEVRFYENTKPAWRENASGWFDFVRNKNNF